MTHRMSFGSHVVIRAITLLFKTWHSSRTYTEEPKNSAVNSAAKKYILVNALAICTHMVGHKTRQFTTEGNSARS